MDGVTTIGWLDSEMIMVHGQRFCYYVALNKTVIVHLPGGRNVPLKQLQNYHPVRMPAALKQDHLKVRHLEEFASRIYTGLERRKFDRRRPCYGI